MPSEKIRCEKLCPDICVKSPCADTRSSITSTKNKKIKNTKVIPDNDYFPIFSIFITEFRGNKDHTCDKTYQDKIQIE